MKRHKTINASSTTDMNKEKDNMGRYAKEGYLKENRGGVVILLLDTLFDCGANS